MPILIFYTAGYRYNFYKNKLEKTGVLSLDSKPKGALIYLNGALQKYKTPAQFSNLLPNEYLIQIQKNGFYPWVKKLKIESNLTTFAKNIILFKQNLPILKVEGEIIDAFISPSFNKIVYFISKNDHKEIRLLSLENNNDEILYQLSPSSEIDFLGWGDNYQLLIKIIDSSSNHLVINIDNKSITKISEISKIDFQLLKWNQDNSNLIYSFKNNILYQINLSEKNIIKVFSENIKDFLISNGTLYYTSETGNELYLNQMKLGQETEEKTKIKLVPNSNYALLEYFNQYLIILDKKNQDLMIISPKIFENPDSIQNYLILQTKAGKINWSQDFKDIVYYTDFELGTYNFETQQNKLITRYGKIIKDAFWHPSKEYLIYQLSDTIQIIELDLRGQKNNYQVVGESVNKLIGSNWPGKKIYFSAKFGEKEGIYELEIQ